MAFISPYNKPIPRYSIAFNVFITDSNKSSLYITYLLFWYTSNNRFFKNNILNDEITIFITFVNSSII